MSTQRSAQGSPAAQFSALSAQLLSATCSCGTGGARHHCDHRTPRHEGHHGRRRCCAPRFDPHVVRRRRLAPRTPECCARRWLPPARVGRWRSCVRDAPGRWQARLLSSGFLMGRFRSRRSKGAASGWNKRPRELPDDDADDGAGADDAAGADATLAAAATATGNQAAAGAQLPLPRGPCLARAGV